MTHPTWPSFAEFMERCLYDPQFGYYAAGHVAFGEGEGKHFWTYPQRLRPFFGQMVAEAARACFREMLDEGVAPDGEPLTILELGAGNGDLAGDAMDWIASRADDPRWDGIAERVRYVIGEFSPALRERQAQRLAAHINAGRAEVRAVDAGDLQWDGPFYGMVVANELIDAFPCERLIVDDVADGEVVAKRTHVRPIDEGDPCTLQEIRIPLSDGWHGADGSAQPVPEPLVEYLHHLVPLVKDLKACDLLPVDLMWSPRTPAFVEGLAGLLHGEERCGLAMLIDYGGTSRHVLDPRAAAPHLRVYGPDGERAHTNRVLEDPGHYDMTWDVDFTDLAALGLRTGLATRFFGHQQVLEQPPIDLWAKENQPVLMRQIRREGETDSMQVLIKAHELAQRFREAGGFRLMVMSSPECPFPEDHFGPSDLIDGRGLQTLAANADPDDLDQALTEELGLEGLAPYIKPCGDVVADLSDRRLYDRRKEVLALLEQRGWLRKPGAILR